MKIYNSEIEWKKCNNRNQKEWKCESVGMSIRMENVQFRSSSVFTKVFCYLCYRYVCVKR
jgi:hypothetical protein